MKRCDTVYLKAKGLKTGQIQQLTGRNGKTIRTHLHLYKDGGIEALKHREPFRPKSQLDEHKQSIEDEFRQRPAASIKEAGKRIFLATRGIIDASEEFGIAYYSMAVRRCYRLDLRQAFLAQYSFSSLDERPISG